VALRLATRHRDRVHALALLATTPCFVEREDWPHAMKAETLDDFARGLRDEPEETLRAFVTLNVLGGPGGRTRVRELTTLLGAVPAPMPETLEAGLALLRGTDLRPEAGRIAQPAAVIHGERDVLVPVGAGRWLAATLPNARLHEIGGAAHLPFVSHARAVADAIESLHG
jgi:pimeloyl-[acyl-carrier protein] methyl ester esterase